METIGRILKSPDGSFFLLGPRGTGKSTWTQAMFPKALRIDLLDQSLCRTYHAHPELLRDRVQALTDRSIVIIDEIQKVPDLLPVVHALIEEKRGWRFVMTGSSARKLKRTGADLLGGRAFSETLHPFMASELGSLFQLDRALRWGLLPVVWASKSPQKVLSAYADLYLREEVQMEGLVRRIGAFARFLEAISFSHASPLNVSNVSRECQVERKVVEGYVGVLEDLLLSYRLPVFTKRAKRELVGHDKFYYFDAGVYQALRPRGPLDRSEEIDGHAFEGLIGQHLRAWIAYGGADHSLSYWRTRHGVEVDFIVYGPRGLWAIEVKNTDRFRPEDIRGLQAFREDYPEAKTLLIYRGRERWRRHGISVIPAPEWLASLKPRQGLLF